MKKIPFKRILGLPASAAILYGARWVKRKLTPMPKMRWEREWNDARAGSKPYWPLGFFRSHMAGSKESADRLCRHEFDLLGSGPVKLGASLDWEKDFSGRGEIKVPWELSRFQFLPALIKAYEAHREERYALHARDLIRDWILKNHPGKSLNWQSPLEAAIRACHLALAWFFLCESRSWKDAAWQKILLTSLGEHGAFLLRNLEYGPGFNTNHLVGDLAGLFFLGVLFPQFREARTWKAKAFAGLERQMRNQVGADGVFHEASTAYHRFACELFGHSALIARENGMNFSPDFLNRLEKMFEFAWYYTKPDGLAPHIGDSDDGRFFLLEDFFDWEPRDHRHLFWLAARLFPQNKKFVQIESPRESSAFHESHFYVMRNHDFYMMTHGGGIGQNSNGGHAHNDALSFELNAGGEDFLVDPGTFCYTSDPAARRRFRGSAMHNTVTVDGKEQNRFRQDTLFGIHPDATPQLNRWDSDENRDILDMQHSGYGRLRPVVTHRRTFFFDKKNTALEINDFFEGSAGRRLEWNFHFAPDVTVERDNETIIAQKNTVRLRIMLPPQLAVHAEIRRSEVSLRYGVKQAAPVLTAALKTNLPLALNLIQGIKFTFRRA